MIELTDCEIDEIVEGTVVEIRGIGAFVELPNKIRGLVHISEVSDDYVVNVSDYLSVGQKIKVKIIGNDNNKIALSIRKVNDKSCCEKYQVNDIVEGTVSGISDFGAFVDLPGGSRGLVHISEISDDYVKNINNYLSIGQKVKVMIIDKKDNKIALSVRRADPKLSKVSGGRNVDPHFDKMLERFLKQSDEANATLEKRNGLC